MTYEELEILVATPLPGKLIELVEAMQELVRQFVKDGSVSIDERSDLSLAECLAILRRQLIEPSHIHDQIKEFVLPSQTKTIVFLLSANGEECKITFDHDSRVYTLHIDTEDGGSITTSPALSKLMQQAMDEFIKPSETAEGFIPGAFIA